MTSLKQFWIAHNPENYTAKDNNGLSKIVPESFFYSANGFEQTEILAIQQMEIGQHLYLSWFGIMIARVEDSKIKYTHHPVNRGYELISSETGIELQNDIDAVNEIIERENLPIV